MSDSVLTPMYYVLGPSGFWSKSNSFTSDVAAAKQFTWQDSIDFCRRRLGAEPGLQCYPLPVAGVAAVHKK